MTKQEWKTRIKQLNDKINALTTWDDYAERLQARYDELLEEGKKYDGR